MLNRTQSPILFALGLAFAAVFVAPVMIDFNAAAIGAECGPAGVELWNLWRTMETQVSGTLGFPGLGPQSTVTAPAVSLAAAALAPLVPGPVAAWNALFLLGYAALIGGTVALGRRLSPNAPLLAHITLLFAVVGCAAWLPLLREQGAGMIPMMCVPLALAHTHSWVQPNAHWRHGASAGALFAIACLGSWGASVLVMVMAPPMVVALIQNLEGHQAKRRGFGALIPGLALGMAHVAATHRSAPGIDVDAILLGSAWISRVEGALAMPATAAVALPSLGILLLALAGVASQPRSTAGWLLTAAWGILVAAADESSALPVAHLTETFPPLERLNGWWAVAPLVSIPLGLAAMKGVEALHRAQRDRLAMAVLALALVDQTLPALSTGAIQRILPAPSPTMLSALSAIPNGGVMQLPASGADCAQADRHRLWQTFHGRPASTAGWDEKDGAMGISYIARLAHNLTSDPPKRASHEAALAPDIFRCAKEDLHTLRDLGFTAVVLDKTTGAHPALAAGLQMVLGIPEAEDETTAVWSVGQAASGQPGEPCPLPQG